MAELEDLIEELGGFGRYQILLIFCITSNLAPVGWSMLLMSFSGAMPDFHCVSNTSGVDQASHLNDSLNVCYLNGSRCSSFVYPTQPQNVISEWNLVCHNEYIKRVIISAQMAGVFAGAILAGQLSDAFGRKKVLYLAQAQQAIVNFIAAMSVSWPMFVTCRFFIGIPMGAIIVVDSYPVEFCPIKWRLLPTVIPAFNVGVCVFALGAYLIQSWSMLHIMCGVMCLFPFLGIFFAPESIRWLATQNKIAQAQKVVEKIASWNKRPVPESSLFVLEQIAAREQIIREDKGRYTYVDIFRTWYSTKISLIFCFFWFALSAGYYGISFGVSSLSGNLQLNIFLMALVDSPLVVCTIYFSNTFGRRKSHIAFCILCLLCIAGVIFIELFAPNYAKGVWINILCFLAKMFINSAWGIVNGWGPELYPTVTRYLGYGFANMGARVGGMLAPFIVNFDSMKFGSYGCLVALFTLSTILSFFVPETKGRVLQDTFELSSMDKPASLRENDVDKEENEKLQSFDESDVINDDDHVKNV